MTVELTAEESDLVFAALGELVIRRTGEGDDLFGLDRSRTDRNVRK